MFSARAARLLVACVASVAFLGGLTGGAAVAAGAQLAGVAGLALLAGAVVGCRSPRPFPSETTPEGAYAHIAVAIAEGRPRDVFAYLEDEAQWAAHTIQKERAAAVVRARRSFPAEEFAPLVAAYGPFADAQDGAEVFVRLGRARGWFVRLHRDLSGVARAEVDADRATIVTARGTHYPMRRRAVGIWGLTSFTAELVSDAERATRDHARIEEAARDYDLANETVSDPKADVGIDSDATHARRGL